jgi:hypothetical protein
MLRNRNHVRRAPDQGAVLMVVMMVILGLMGLGMTALWVTSGNMQMGANVNLRTQALYVAEAGVHRAQEILNAIAPPPDLTLQMTGSGHALDDVPTDVDANGIPNGVGAIMIDLANIPLAGLDYPNALTSQRDEEVAVAGAPQTNATMGRYTVWIRNDTAELRRAKAAGTSYVVDGNNAIVVRSRGVAADGRTNVVLEVTLGPSPAAAADPNNAGPPPPELCNSGKNACDDNNSTQAGIVVN